VTVDVRTRAETAVPNRAANVVLRRSTRSCFAIGAADASNPLNELSNAVFGPASSVLITLTAVAPPPSPERTDVAGLPDPAAASTDR